MLLTEYNEQAHIENERKIAADEAFEQGMEIGMEQGLERGMEQGLERGMEQGIKTGTERFALLTKRLMQEARTDALLRATEEKEFREKLYEEYGI